MRAPVGAILPSRLYVTRPPSQLVIVQLPQLLAIVIVVLLILNIGTGISKILFSLIEVNLVNFKEPNA